MKQVPVCRQFSLPKVGIDAQNHNITQSDKYYTREEGTYVLWLVLTLKEPLGCYIEMILTDVIETRELQQIKINTSTQNTLKQRVVYVAQSKTAVVYLMHLVRHISLALQRLHWLGSRTDSERIVPIYSSD